MYNTAKKQEYNVDEYLYRLELSFKKSSFEGDYEVWRGSNFCPNSSYHTGTLANWKKKEKCPVLRGKIAAVTGVSWEKSFGDVGLLWQKSADFKPFNADFFVFERGFPWWTRFGAAPSTQCLASYFLCQQTSWNFEISCQDLDNYSWQGTQDIAKIFKIVERNPMNFLDFLARKPGTSNILAKEKMKILHHCNIWHGACRSN